MKRHMIKGIAVLVKIPVPGRDTFYEQNKFYSYADMKTATWHEDTKKILYPIASQNFFTLERDVFDFVLNVGKVERGESVPSPKGVVKGTVFKGNMRVQPDPYDSKKTARIQLKGSSVMRVIQTYPNYQFIMDPIKPANDPCPPELQGCSLEFRLII